MDLEAHLASGQLARLIPSVAESKKEERATSIVLAAFMAVPEFTSEVLGSIGVSIRKRTKIECYSEVVFKGASKAEESRPDGLIIIKTGSKVWTALIESKIGRSELSQEQVEAYLNLAKELKINAVITLSNQFAATPRHHPLKVSRTKTRFVDFLHFSWLSLKSSAAILVNEKGISDPDQAYILSEVVRYLDSDSSGVEPFSRMPATWRDLCVAIRNGAAVDKNSEMVLESVAAWHQLLRQLSLDLSIAIGNSVKMGLTRENVKNPESFLVQEVDALKSTGCLETELIIPNAASKIKVKADIARKIVFISMKIDAPKDTKRATASINWLTRQFKGKDVNNLSIRAYWPRRTSTTMKPFDAVEENPAILVLEGISTTPTALEVCRIIDLGAKFKGVKTFVEDISGEIPKFYRDAGQHLSNWVPKAPKIKVEKTVQENTEPTIQSAPTIFSGLFLRDKEKPQTQ